MSNNKSGILKYNRTDTKHVQDTTVEFTSGSYVNKLDPGTHRIRLLPPLGILRKPFVDTHRHYYRTAFGLFITNCPMSMYEEPCPICERRNDLIQEQGTYSSREVRELEPKYTFIANAIFRDREGEGPKIWSCDKQAIYQGMLRVMAQHQRTAGACISDPYEGLDIEVIREGSGMRDTRYKVQPAHRSTPLHEEEATMAKWVNEMAADLTKESDCLGYEEILEGMREASKPKAPKDGKPSAAAEHALEGSQRDESPFQGDYVTSTELDNDEIPF